MKTTQKPKKAPPKQPWLVYMDQPMIDQIGIEAEKRGLSKTSLLRHWIFLKLEEVKNQ